jgi:predicted RNase H-like nuclease (RuvC/YqgF family)
MIDNIPIISYIVNMKDDRGSLDLTKQIEDLKAEVESLKAALARAKEDHQYDNLVHQKELESLRNPVNRLRNKGLM